MGTVYYVHRLSPDYAVDLLCLRRRFQDMDCEEIMGPYHAYVDPCPQHVPRTLNFTSGQANVDLAMMGGPEAGGVASNLWEWFRHEESDDPRVWATRSARLVGWHNLDLPLIPGATRFPYRYSLPEEIPAIRDTLGETTVEELRSNLRASFKQDLVETRGISNRPQDQIIEEVPPRLLETLKALCESADAAGEIVIYNLR